jgi:hypothetical protein
MIKPCDAGKLKAVDKASKDYQKAGVALAKAVAAAFPPKTRVRIPVGRGLGEGVVAGRPDPDTPLRVPVQLDSFRVFKRAILYTEIEILEDLFPEESEQGASLEVAPEVSNG